jgi:hypothetical protein
MDCEYFNGASLLGSSIPERCSSDVHIAMLMLVRVQIAMLDEVRRAMQSTGRPLDIPLIIRNSRTNRLPDLSGSPLLEEG